MQRNRFLPVVMAVLLGAGAAAAQPMRDRFDAANVTHDGRLTREQAQAGGLRGVARFFDQIDADHKGYVTIQDIRVWAQARRAERQARMQGGPGSAPGSYPPPGQGAGPANGQGQGTLQSDGSYAPPAPVAPNALPPYPPAPQ